MIGISAKRFESFSFSFFIEVREDYCSSTAAVQCSVGRESSSYTDGKKIRKQ